MMEEILVNQDRAEHLVNTVRPLARMVAVPGAEPAVLFSVEGEITAAMALMVD